MEQSVGCKTGNRLHRIQKYYSPHRSTLSAENFQIANGRFLKAYDLLNNAKVCVLGSDVALNLFGPDTDPINKEVKIQGMRYTVVGVTKPKEFFDGNYNDRVMIPSTTGQKRYYGKRSYRFFNC